MRFPVSGSGKVLCVVLLSMTAGCASRGAPSDCAALNAEIGTTSKDISSAAIRRGKIESYNVPFWVPGGRKAVSALKNRQTRRIDRLEGKLSQMTQDRKARCGQP